MTTQTFIQSLIDPTNTRPRALDRSSHLHPQKKRAPRRKPDTAKGAESFRSTARIISSATDRDGNVASAGAFGPLTSVDLVQNVLDAEFAGGAWLAYTGGSFSHFQRTHWVALSDEELGRAILSSVLSRDGRRGTHTRAVIREVIDLLKMHRATGIDSSRLDEPLPVINVANGELWMAPDGSMSLRPHNPSSDQRYCLDVTFDEYAQCPIYDRTLAEIFSASTDPGALVDFWHEFTGYVLQPTRPEARIFVGYGGGGDGKSALASLLAHLVGTRRVAAMPIGKLSNRFILSHLSEKALLLDDDVAVGTVLPDGLLKTISEAKVVTAEPKHRDPFEFQVRAVPLLLCNRIPGLRDTSYGFRRRLTVFPFDRHFGPTETDPTLFGTIRATEMSGVLNRALAGLQRLIRRRWKFDPPKAVSLATDAWWTEAIGTAAMSGQALEERRLKFIPRSASAEGDRLNCYRDASSTAVDPGAAVDVRVELPSRQKACLVQVRIGSGPLSC